MLPGSLSFAAQATNGSYAQKAPFANTGSLGVPDGAGGPKAAFRCAEQCRSSTRRTGHSLRALDWRRSSARRPDIAAARAKLQVRTKTACRSPTRRGDRPTSSRRVGEAQPRLLRNNGRIATLVVRALHCDDCGATYQWETICNRAQSLVSIG
ncbi:MAG: hypothetical protein ACJAST_004230 [Halopseudomonas sp.]|jgi:hypothetical protein